MTTRGLQVFGLLCASWLLAACDQGRTNPPDTGVIVANAAPSFSSLIFRREEATIPDPTTLSYLAGASFTYDEDQYDFNIEVSDIATGALTRLKSFNVTMSTDSRYMFVLTEVGGLIEPVVLEYTPLDGAAPGAQALALHAAEGAPAVNLYLEAPGTDVAAATPRATLSFGQAVTPWSLAAGDYELTLTEGGNPANVLLTSTTFTVPAASTASFVIVSGGNIGPASLGVMVLDGAAANVIIDKNTGAELRVLNGATDTLPRDVALNSQFAPPAFASVPFATDTAYVPLAAGSNTVDVTPAGNPGVSELNQSLTVAINTRYTLLFSGDAGALKHALVTDDTRRIATEAKVRLLNVAQPFALVDFFVVRTDTDINTVLPIASLAAPGTSSVLSIPPGTYDVVLRENGTTNVLAGPQSITVAGGGIYTVLGVSGADAASAGLVLLDDF